MKILKLLLLPALVSVVICQLTVQCDDVLRIPVDSQYQYSLSAAGGKLPYTYSATGLPQGISVSGNSIRGSSNVVGVFPVVITVNDASNTAANKHIFVYITSPTSGSSGSNTQVITTTTTATRSGSTSNAGSSNIPSSTIQNSQSGSTQTQSSSSLTSTSSSSSSSSSQNNNGQNEIGILTRIPQGSSSTTASTNYNIQSNSGSINLNAQSGQPQSVQTGSFVIDIPSNPNTRVIQLQSPNPVLSFNSPSNNPSNSQPTIVTNTPLIVPTTTPYITNYSFASSLQSTPVVSSTRPTDAAFQRQSDINKAISSLLSMIQGFNATLLNIQNNIPNTTSLLNEAIRNQRVAQAQVNSIIAQNTSLTNNISGIEAGIKTLQNQMVSTTSTLNNSNAQVQSLQTKITQNYIQINETKNKIQQANNSLQDSQDKRQRAAAAINQSRDIILKCTQNITSIQTDINNAPTMLNRLGDQINNQKTIILALQKQLEAAILALVPIQTQVDYYTMIPTVGPGLIQQNKTILLVESDNLARAQPVYDSSKNEIDTYNNLINQLSTAMNSLQNQLSADQLAYDNIVGSQNNQEGLFNNTLITIAAQTQLLNRVKQQQQNLLTASYTAAQQVVSDSTSKVNQLTETLNSLNRRYQEVQNNIVVTQRTLNEAIQQKELIDQQVNQAIQGGGSSASSASYSSFGSNTGSNIQIDIRGN